MITNPGCDTEAADGGWAYCTASELYRTELFVAQNAAQVVPTASAGVVPTAEFSGAAVSVPGAAVLAAAIATVSYLL